MAIFLKYDQIEGNSTTDKFEKWIELDSFQWGVGRGIGAPTGGSSVRESSAASVSEITVSKQFDKSSTKLLEEALYGKPVKAEVVFTRVKTGGGAEEFLRYELTNTLTSGYSISSGGDRPSESISLNFTKVMMQNSVAKDDQTGTPVATTYDLATTKNA